MEIRLVPTFHSPDSGRPGTSPPPSFTRPADFNPAAVQGTNSSTAQGTAVVADRASEDPSLQEPTKRIDALVDRMREQVKQRMERRDVDDGQRAEIRELFGAFEAAMGGIAEKAESGELTPDQVSEKIQAVLERVHNAAQEVLDPSEDDGPDPGPNGPTGGTSVGIADIADLDPESPVTRPDTLGTRAVRSNVRLHGAGDGPAGDDDGDRDPGGDSTAGNGVGIADIDPETNDTRPGKPGLRAVRGNVRLHGADDGPAGDDDSGRDPGGDSTAGNGVGIADIDPETNDTRPGKPGLRAVRGNVRLHGAGDGPAGDDDGGPDPGGDSTAGNGVGIADIDPETNDTRPGKPGLRAMRANVRLHGAGDGPAGDDDGGPDPGGDSTAGNGVGIADIDPETNDTRPDSLGLRASRSNVRLYGADGGSDPVDTVMPYQLLDDQV